MMIPDSQRVPTGSAQPSDVTTGKTFMSGASFELKTGTAQPPTGGNAAPEHVLTGKTFTNDSGEQTGTMVDQTGSSMPAQWGNSSSSTEIDVTVPKGYYPGGEQNLRANDTNLLPTNIMSGVTIFGVIGTATTDADATAADIRQGKTAYVNGQKITGTAVF